MSSALRDEVHQMVDGFDESQLLELKRWAKSLRDNDGLSEEDHAEINRRLLQSQKEYESGQTHDAFEVIAELKQRHR